MLFVLAASACSGTAAPTSTATPALVSTRAPTQTSVAAPPAVTSVASIKATTTAATPTGRPLESPTQPMTPRPGIGKETLPLLSKPFSGEFVLGNFFDHDVPYEFIDNNGFQLTTWGARTVAGVDGHNGYDWYMPDGTPLSAAGDGVVARAGASSPFFCPFLGRTVSDSLGVDIIHITSDGPRFRTSASHMSRVDVSVGQIISSGDQIGLSGHSGCTTVSHVHFTVQRLAPGAAHGVVVDPYGWESPQPDPWELHPDGAMSLWLWRDREAPAIYREQVASIQTSGNPRVRISRLRWMGWQDDVFPNNQFV